MTLENVQYFMYAYIVIIGIIAYLLGSINTSIIVSKIKGTDIREHGSGNAGLTNTLRTFGKGAAAVVLLGDILKGVIAVLIPVLLTPIFREYLINTINDIGIVFLMGILDLTVLVQVAGIAVVLGHNFPIFYKFKGGKGVLTSVTVLFMVNWKIGLICLATFIVVVLITRYVSLGSIISSIVAVLVVIFFENSWFGNHVLCPGDQIMWLPMFLVLSLLIIARHHGNIHRLILGEERKLSFCSKSTEK